MSSPVPLPVDATPIDARSRAPALLRTLSFARGLWRIASAGASAGNRVELLRDGGQAFDAMLGAIADARDSVALECYLVTADAVGNRFADALVAAAARGVRVRMVTDWVGSRGAGRAYWKRLRDADVHVRVFNPPGLRPWLGMLPRDHRKLLVTDDAVGITGGFGLSELWSGGVRRRRTAPWRDTAVSIEGPAAVDMSRAFQLMWRRANFEQRPKRWRRRQLVRPARGADTDPQTSQGAVVGIVEGEPWRLRVARALQIQAASAEKCIWIASAYFYPSSAELEALAGAAQDGVDVRLLVPSKYDHPWVRRLTRRVYHRLLRNGVRIWEWNGAMMHAKTSVVDGHWVRVGSTDFNPLGIAINYELDAIIEDSTLGEQAVEMYLADLACSTEIRWRGRAVKR
jgi:cardiolipin synthase